MDEEPDNICYFCGSPLIDGMKFEVRGYTLCCECKLDPLKLGMIE